MQEPEMTSDWFAAVREGWAREEFVEAMSHGKRLAFHTSFGATVEEARVVACVEDVLGFFELSNEPVLPFAKAQAEADARNARLGLARRDVVRIVASTMGSPRLGRRSRR